MITAEAVDAVAEHLAESGLNRCQVANASTLPADIWLPGAVSRDYSANATPATLLLVGHGGTAMWDHLTELASSETLVSDDNPIDTFSIEATESAIEQTWPDVGRRLLYPHPDCPIDLVALGRAIGWQGTSPLGLGIHPKWGLWSAYRALWELSAPLAKSEEMTAGLTIDVCGSCSTQDCVAACPADAVSVGRRFGLAACFDYRAQSASQCGETCLSRRACPVGVEHGYSDEQMSYHYRLSRPAQSTPGPADGGGPS